MNRSTIDPIVFPCIINIHTAHNICIYSSAKPEYIYIYICMYILIYVAFCPFGQYRDRRKPEAGTKSYSYFELLQGFFIVHSIIDSTLHSMPLNNQNDKYPARVGFELIPPGYKPQSIRMRHRDRPARPKTSQCLRFKYLYNEYIILIYVYEYIILI